MHYTLYFILKYEKDYLNSAENFENQLKLEEQNICIM